MSNNDSLISQNNSFLQEEKNYNSLLAENNRLRIELEKFRSRQIDIEKIILIQKELVLLKGIAQSENIDLVDFAKSFQKAIEKIFCIRKTGLKERSQKVISMIFSLYENEAKWDFSKEKDSVNREEKPKYHSVFASNVKQEVKSEVKSEEFSKKIQPKSQYVEDEKTQKKPIYDKFNQIEKDSKEKVQERPSINIQNEKTQKKEPVVEQIQKRKEEVPHSNLQKEIPLKEDKKPFNNKDQYEQSKIHEAKQQQYQLSFPINWQQKSYFKVDSGIMRKMINDDYRKIRAVNPFPKDGQHTVRFQMVKQGTVAFGIVTDQYKDGIFIDDRKVDAIKYLSFYNGGGKLSMNGLELSEGRRLHLRQSEIIEITFDADRCQVTYKNKNLPKNIVIELEKEFKTRQLYFFVEMKTLSTTIRIL